MRQLGMGRTDWIVALSGLWCTGRPTRTIWLSVLVTKVGSCVPYGVCKTRAWAVMALTAGVPLRASWKQDMLPLRREGEKRL